MTDCRLQISFSIAENVSLAFYQNAVPFLRELTITNETGKDLSDVSVRLTSEPPFLTSRLWRVDRISDKASHHIRPLDLKLDPTFLSGLTAARRAEIRLFVEAANETVAERNLEINLLPPSHWGGMSAAPELLAAFVRPNDPSVDVILREAADKLAQAGRDPAIDGYKQSKKARAWEIAEAIWTALVARSIAYVLPPKSFERHGQQIRGPSEILARQVGTCLDLALFYAACVEQAGLNPLIVLTEGHAFTGVWLVDEDFTEVTVDDAQALRKRVQLQELALVETTLLTGSTPSRFKHAVEQGGQQIAEDTAPVLELAVDVRRARAAGIKPMDLAAAAEPATEAKVAAVAEQALEDTPRFDEEFDTHGQQDAKPIDRLEGWKRALLDLSLRNRLLNFKEGKNVIPLECPAPAKLEDMLAAGREFKLLGRATVLDGKDGRDPGIFANTFKEDGRKSFLLEAIEREEIHTRMLEADLEARLTDLFRTARLAFEEGGANVLYLCLGFLKWSPKDGAGPYRAPLILVPVSLERKSIRSGFRLKLHEDETRFNPTLLQMLRQDFELSAPELDGDLPRDASGTDVIGVWRIVQKHVRPIKGWEVIEDVALATLSFTKYLLWKDLVDRADELKRNPIVKHLIDTPTHSFEGSSGDFVEPTSLDTAVDPAELFTPLSADSSQLAAVVSAQRGKDFVLFGPPGTGKSQTIANLIANCLAHGKSVLFVSQKTAALEVVRRRLDDIGIGGYCLEVHSTKAQKSSVVAQLADAWRERCCADDVSWQAATAQLGTMRTELNRLVSALHRRRSNGMTAYEAFGRVIASREFYPEVDLSWPRDINHDPHTLAALSAASDRIAVAMRGVGDPSTHPLKGMRQTRWTPSWRDETTVAIDRLDDAVQILRRSVEAFAASIGLDQHVMGLAHLPELLKLGAALTAFDAVDCASAAALLRDDTKSAIEQGLGELKSLSDRARALRKEMDASYAPAVLRLDFNQLESDWNAACGANFFVREGRKGKVRQQLQPYCETPPQDIARDIVRLRDLASIASRADGLKTAFAGVERLCRGLDTDIGAIERLIAWSIEMREAVRSFATESDDASWLLDHVALLLADYPHLLAARGAAREAFDAAQASWADAQSAIAELARCAGFEDVVGFVESRADWDEELLDRSARWRAYLIQAPEWANWRAVAAEATQLGLGPLVNWIEASVVPIESVRPAFEFSYARWFAEKVVNEDEVLSSFLAVRHEAAIEAFIKADKRVGELSKEIIRARIGGGIPSRTNFGADPEWGTLARETQKRTQHMPLRQLFSRIPNALTKLTPCLMMSPLSIAQYLPPGARPFDVVIFDEASQIQVCDAIGAIARGNQAIIVGDPEQLPPTSVGERVIDVDDDRVVLPSQKSILDECLASNIPAMRLRWHYRSRHESLIAFSNAKYYKGELVTFPSPVTRDDAVRFIDVPDGVYERGGSKTNRKESQAVVDEVVRRLKSADYSIGVVTFNAEQQKLIENQLDQARRSDPSLERFFDAKQVSEPVLVKNIENIQGDERDVIIFSVAVGPDQTGRVTAQISSLNSEGGHRRLNVAITRARRELLVYSSLRPEQIDLGRTSAKGVVDFKHFLEFARKGARAIAESFSSTGGETESPFEAGVKRALELKGWEVHPQIGVSFFRIDLGVVHPDEPGRYLAGVECDGATYHRSATARDRDRLREWVLTDLGWRIRRIWSTDWWMNPAAALEKLHARLEQDLAEDRAAASERDEARAEPAGPRNAEEPASEAPPLQATPEPLTPKMDEARAVEQAPAKAYADKVRSPQKAADMVYVLSDFTAVASPDQSRFYDRDYRPVLRDMVEHVATVEGPLFFDILVDRISRAHGFRRSADRIQGIVKTALGSSSLPVTREGDREIVWPPGADPLGLRPYRKGQRDHADIPLPELASLAAQFLREGLEGELLVREIQDHFGLGRLFTSTRERFEAAIKLALRVEEQRKDPQS